MPQFDEDSYVALLAKLIDENRFVQNNPPDLIPQEGRIAKHVLEALTPYSKATGGPLDIQVHEFAEGRPNIVVRYATHSDGDQAPVLSFVGCHMDVVPANPDGWEFDPFEFSRDGDKLRGRGTTDCLGHVALLTELFRTLAAEKTQLKTTVIGVFIANEENSSILGIGVDELVKRGLIADCKRGPVFWVDSADKNPCIGTGGMSAWTLKARGKGFHSGLAHKAINPMELVMEALSKVQAKFYEAYPRHAREDEYGFVCASTMKPTQWSYPGNGVNAIPAQCQISGDIRLTPFYDIGECRANIERWVAELNADLQQIPTRGPASKYELPEETLRGSLELTFEPGVYPGIACNLASPGFKLLCDATRKVIGDAKPYSITGSLPLVRELQESGFDLQICGYGLMSTYHANNEFCKLSDMRQGFEIFAEIIAQTNL